jgi:hypothetical protein
MSMLGTLLSRASKRPAGIVTTGARNARDAERYDAYIPVLVWPRGIPAVAGVVFNISLDGAAIRIPGSEATEPAGWLTRLNQSEEMRLTGLLYTPMSCWVVVVDSDVLRVHFSLDDACRRQLREVLGKLARPGQPRPDNASLSRASLESGDGETNVEAVPAPDNAAESSYHHARKGGILEHTLRYSAQTDPRQS